MEDTYKEYPFTVTGTVYATSESHASHFVYWAMERAEEYRDASQGQIRLGARGLDTATPAPKPASAHVALQQ